MARIQGNIYKAPPHYQQKVQMILIQKKILVAIFCYYISFYNTLSCSDFGIGGVVVGTTLVITFIEEVSLFIQISKQEFGPVWVRTIRLTKSRFINNNPTV